MMFSSRPTAGSSKIKIPHHTLTHSLTLYYTQLMSAVESLNSQKTIKFCIMHILHHLNSNESWNEPDIHRKQYDFSGFSDQVVAIWMGKLEGNSPGHCPVGGHSYVKLVSRSRVG